MEWLFLWHQWRLAVWAARLWSGEIFTESYNYTGIDRDARWIKSRAAQAFAGVMKDYHKSRMNHYDEFLRAHLFKASPPE